MAPAFFVPVNGTHNSDPFSMTPVDNMHARYYSIPMEFLLREGGYGGSVDFGNDSDDEIRIDKQTLRYLSANEEGRERMYKELLKSLRRNSEPPSTKGGKKLFGS